MIPSLAHKWNMQTVDTWRREVARRAALSPHEGLKFYVPSYYVRAVRALHAAEDQLAITLAGGWPDDDRAPRFTLDEPTRPG